MILILCSLAVAGFFFPPAWLGFVGYVIYIFVSRHRRRDDAIEIRVQKMVAAGKSFAVFQELYYEAARAYCVRKGSTISDHNGASTTIIVNNHPYSVSFVPAAGPRGGTGISIDDYSRFEKDADDFVARFR